jgi:hypothetical protein
MDDSGEQKFSDELGPVIDRLRAEKPQAPRSELDRIKLRAISQASEPARDVSSRRRKPRQKRLLAPSWRAASIAIAIALLGGGTAVLAASGKKPFSGGSSTTGASNSQYCPPGSQQGGKKQDPRPENCGVALTPGYWKNHQRHTELLLPVSLGSYSVTNFSQVTAVFKGMNCGSNTDQGAVGCLAGHLLAAELNVKNGASTCIQPTINQADAFLVSIGYTGPSGTYTLTAAQRAEAIQIKNALDKYNNTGSC